MTAVVNANSRWRLVASYAVGVWGGLTAWAALAWCVIGSAVVGGLLRGWERQDVAPR